MGRRCLVMTGATETQTAEPIEFPRKLEPETIEI